MQCFCVAALTPALRMCLSLLGTTQHHKPPHCLFQSGYCLAVEGWARLELLIRIAAKIRHCSLLHAVSAAYDDEAGREFRNPDSRNTSKNILPPRP
ncbi:hypothetical protein EJ03DRAFT_116057 [Teratosphaeria nubilosa]|uniref:Secreted protein n=1 Tax=Teratosphaeria nubilosa TaxID=161662 RepID=A0A6G1L701_9PEZI|nr:hypothetical protein EJ03DRAFT_116057 [Teratosphaeria nubilosa]